MFQVFIIYIYIYLFSCIYILYIIERWRTTASRSFMVSMAYKHSLTCLFLLYTTHISTCHVLICTHLYPPCCPLHKNQHMPLSMLTVPRHYTRSCTCHYLVFILLLLLTVPRHYTRSSTCHYLAAIVDSTPSLHKKQHMPLPCLYLAAIVDCTPSLHKKQHMPLPCLYLASIDDCTRHYTRSSTCHYLVLSCCYC